MDVTKENFYSILPQLEELVATADYLAVDFEMTGLYLNDSQSSQTDSVETRYHQMAQGVKNYTTLQMGLTLTHYDPQTQIATHTPYNFYTFQSSVNALKDPGLYRVFDLSGVDSSSCSAITATTINHDQIAYNVGAIEFNADHGMDFQKWVRQGVPFLPRTHIVVLEKYAQQRILNEERYLLPSFVEQRQFTKLLKSQSSRVFPGNDFERTLVQRYARALQLWLYDYLIEIGKCGAEDKALFVAGLSPIKGVPKPASLTAPSQPSSPTEAEQATPAQTDDDVYSPPSTTPTIIPNNSESFALSDDTVSDRASLAAKVESYLFDLCAKHDVILRLNSQKSPSGQRGFTATVYTRQEYLQHVYKVKAQVYKTKLEMYGISYVWQVLTNSVLPSITNSFPRYIDSMDENMDKIEAEIAQDITNLQQLLATSSLTAPTTTDNSAADMTPEITVKGASCPIVVHNGFFDVMFMYNQFEAKLPATFHQFAPVWMKFFPQGCYDTKYIFFHPQTWNCFGYQRTKGIVPSLGGLYEWFCKEQQFQQNKLLEDQAKKATRPDAQLTEEDLSYDPNYVAPTPLVVHQDGETVKDLNADPALTSAEYQEELADLLADSTPSAAPSLLSSSVVLVEAAPESEVPSEVSTKPAPITELPQAIKEEDVPEGAPPDSNSNKSTPGKKRREQRPRKNNRDSDKSSQFPQLFISNAFRPGWDGYGPESNRFHEAGYDSYCTAVLFSYLVQFIAGERAFRFEMGKPSDETTNHGIFHNLLYDCPLFTNLFKSRLNSVNQLTVFNLNYASYNTLLEQHIATTSTNNYEHNQQFLLDAVKSLTYPSRPIFNPNPKHTIINSTQISPSNYLTNYLFWPSDSLNYFKKRVDAYVVHVDLQSFRNRVMKSGLVSDPMAIPYPNPSDLTRIVKAGFLQHLVGLGMPKSDIDNAKGELNVTCNKVWVPSVTPTTTFDEAGNEVASIDKTSKHYTDFISFQLRISPGSVILTHYKPRTEQSGNVFSPYELLGFMKMGLARAVEVESGPSDEKRPKNDDKNEEDRLTCKEPAVKPPHFFTPVFPSLDDFFIESFDEYLIQQDIDHFRAINQPVPLLTYHALASIQQNAPMATAGDLTNRAVIPTSSPISTLQQLQLVQSNHTPASPWTAAGQFIGGTLFGITLTTLSLVAYWFATESSHQGTQHQPYRRPF